jgi:F-type H+-transporting ATPase subunit b
MTTMKTMIRSLAVLVLVSCSWVAVTSISGSAQEQAARPSAQNSSEKSGTEKPAQPADQAGQPQSQPTSAGEELAKETREAEGEEEENANLKHSAMVQKLAKLTGLSVHGAHLLALGLNFAIIVILVVWAVRKSVPGMLRKRGESIQHALEEARKASQEANKRLADIENRLRQMDVEIGRMQASAEKEAEGEEARIKQAAEDEMRKIVEAAEQEIAAAAKQARRELSTHTADLAIALARKQINVDSNTDQVLVRDFAAKLASKPSSQGGGGKDGR